HPVTKERALILNLNMFSKRGLSAARIRAFLPDYSQLHWVLHRFSWRHSWVDWVENLDVLFRDPKFALEYTFRALAGKASGGAEGLPDSRVDSAFTKEDIKGLAKSIRDRFSSFTWRRGDMLLIDNLKLAHEGMPGFGPRELAVLIANPLR